MRESFVEFEKFLLSLNARRGVSVCGGESDEFAVLLPLRVMTVVV